MTSGENRSKKKAKKKKNLKIFILQKRTISKHFSVILMAWKNCLMCQDSEKGAKIQITQLGKEVQATEKSQLKMADPVHKQLL